MAIFPNQNVGDLIWVALIAWLENDSLDLSDQV
jgi:hypothetical protein